MSLYTSFSNYEEYTQKARAREADKEPEYWGDRSEEYRQYRSDWNRVAKDPSFIPKTPLCITIDASSLCQLRCLGCHQSIPGAIENPGSLKFADACKIIDQMAEHNIPSLSFAWKGEPLLCKDLEDIVWYATKKEILEIRMVTNGLPPKQRPDSLIILAEAGIHRIIISVDGHSTKSFETYRRGANYNELMANIHKLIQWKRKKKSDFPLIRIQCVRNKFNDHEIDEFVYYWHNIEGVNDVRISDVMSRTGDAKSPFSISNQVTCGRVPCPQIRTRIVISDQVKNAYACCHDWGETYSIGDVRDKHLMEIWRGDEITHLRKMHADGKIEEMPMCKTGRCAAKETYIFKKDTL